MQLAKVIHRALPLSSFELALQLVYDAYHVGMDKKNYTEQDSHNSPKLLLENHLEKIDRMLINLRQDR